MKIGIIGPPGSGKTTLAAELFVHLKKMNKKVELIPELIKLKVYQGQDFNKSGFDITNAWEQQNLEESLKNTPFDFIIFEAPLCNGYFYSLFYQKIEEALVLKTIAKQFINDYDIILHLNMCEKKQFESFGRNESYEQAVELDLLIDRTFKKLDFQNYYINVEDRNDIPELIKKIIHYKKTKEKK